LRDATWVVGVSRRYKDLCLEVGATTASLAQRLGRDPSIDAVAAELGVTPDEVAEAMVAGAAYQARSLDRSVFGEDHGFCYPAIPAANRGRLCRRPAGVRQPP
jgi:RNA polymerase sigma-B factor